MQQQPPAPAPYRPSRIVAHASTGPHPTTPEAERWRQGCRALAALALEILPPGPETDATLATVYDTTDRGLRALAVAAGVHSARGGEKPQLPEPIA